MVPDLNSNVCDDNLNNTNAASKTMTTTISSLLQNGGISASTASNLAELSSSVVENNE